MQLKTSTPANPVYGDTDSPVLCLHPLNGWETKRILLTDKPVIIGRHTSVKTEPSETNGIFDAKVLSRRHAEVWAASGRILLTDTRSSNGTFVNGERLSAEGLKSEPQELKSGDILEFGIDIVGEDDQTIIHHKVAARAECINLRENKNIEAVGSKEHHIFLVRNFMGTMESRQWIQCDVQVGSGEARE